MKKYPSIGIALSVLSLVIMMGSVAVAIDWRDPLDDVHTNITEAQTNKDTFRMWAIDTFKETEQQRAMAEQLERIADQLVSINQKLAQQSAANTAIQAMFASTIHTNSTALRELVDAVDALTP